MKQFFILCISMLTATIAATAGNVTREIKLTQAIHSIEINHDINVVLTESTDATIRITGEEKATKAVLYDLKNGRMRLLSKKGSLKDRITVFIPVRNLRELNINGTSSVLSNGALTSTLLHVTLAGQAKVAINNIGDIKFYAEDDVDMQVKKWVTKRVCQ